MGRSQGQSVKRGVLVQEGFTTVSTFSSHFGVCWAEHLAVSFFFQAERVMAGAAVRGRQRFLRSTWGHEQMAMKMAIATCAHHSVQTATSRPTVVVFLTSDSEEMCYGISISDIDVSSFASSELVVSDTGLVALAFSVDGTCTCSTELGWSSASPPLVPSVARRVRAHDHACSTWFSSVQRRLAGAPHLLSKCV